MLPFKNEDVLKKVAMTDSDSDVRIAAIKKISNEEMLVEIAKEEDNAKVRISTGLTRKLARKNVKS